MPIKRLEYIQDSKTLENVNTMGGDETGTQQAKVHLIKPNDELLIKVSSFDDISFNYFNSQGNNNTFQASNELSINTISYLVDVDGYINFPITGKILLKGLSLDEATVKIQNILKPYFDQPNVMMKYAYKKVSILGEVNSPGYYTYTKDQITIFEALAMANDLTIHGNRKEVLLIRENTDNKISKYEIDLTKDKDVFGYSYYIQPGDVLYVKPRKSVKWSTISTPITLLFSTITTALLVYNAIQN